MACSISKASAPLHSPTIIRSGRIRSEERIRSRMDISRTPSIFAVRVSRRIRFGIDEICSSAESSIVISRSSEGINSDRALRNVVFPAPVPPDTKILYPAWMSFFRNAATSCETAPNWMSWFIVIG